MKNTTRAKSNQQEKRIAKALGGKRVIGSGATPFLKGDVIVDKLFIEAKTKMEPSKSISVKREWLEKAKEQALATRKEDYALAISFGDNKEFYIIEDTLMEDLYKSREALRDLQNFLDTSNNGIVEIIQEEITKRLEKVFS